MRAALTLNVMGGGSASPDGAALATIVKPRLATRQEPTPMEVLFDESSWIFFSPTTNAEEEKVREEETATDDFRMDTRREEACGRAGRTMEQTAAILLF